MVFTLPQLRKRNWQLNSTDISSKRVEKNTILFLNQRGVEENLEIKIKTTPKWLNFGTIGLIAHWKFDVLKSSIFALEASLLGQIFVLRASNFRGAAVSRWFLDRNTLLFN